MHRRRRSATPDRQVLGDFIGALPAAASVVDTAGEVAPADDEVEAVANGADLSEPLQSLIPLQLRDAAAQEGSAGVDVLLGAPGGRDTEGDRGRFGGVEHSGFGGAGHRIAGGGGHSEVDGRTHHVSIVHDTHPPSADTSDPTLPDLSTCLICLDPVEFGLSGREARTTYPCCRVDVHLGCLADLFANQQQASCPQCQIPLEPLLNHPDFLQFCLSHGVVSGIRASSSNTIRNAVADYTVRTFSAADVPQPPHPPHVHVLCCHRISGPPDFIELPDREMTWAPEVTERHAEGGIADWREQWMCPRCSRTLSPSAIDAPTEARVCALCDQPCRWSYDTANSTGVWSCHRCRISYTPPAREQSHEVRTSIEPTTTPAVEQRQPVSDIPVVTRHRTVFDYPPPEGVVHRTTNSEIYIPLLHDAVGMLSVQSASAWRRHQVASAWWHNTSAYLAQLSTIDPRHFLTIYASLIQTAQEEHPTSDILHWAVDLALIDEFHSAIGSLPTETQTHLR